MEYTTLNHSQAEQLSNFLPDEIGAKIATDEACVIGAAEGDSLVSLGVFSFDEFTDDYVECLYLYTVPEERRKGYATGLLFYAESVFRGKNLKNLCFNLSDRPEKMTEWNAFLSKLGYQPLDMNWHILEYDFTTIESSPGIRSCSGNELSFQSLDRRQISYMLHQDKSIPRVIREIIRNEADWQKSLFYSMQGHLAAGVMIRDNGVDDLSIHALYLSSQLKNRGILLVMLAKAVDMMKSARSQEARVYFYVEYQRQIEAYRTLFGNPRSDYLICRLEKTL